MLIVVGQGAFFCLFHAPGEQQLLKISIVFFILAGFPGKTVITELRKLNWNNQQFVGPVHACKHRLYGVALYLWMTELVKSKVGDIIHHSIAFILCKSVRTLQSATH